MSLVCDGVTDALHATSGISGITYPFTLAMWTKPPNITQDRGPSALSLQGSDINFSWADHHVGDLRMVNRYAAVDANPTIVGCMLANAWQSIIFVCKDNNEKWVYHNGVISAVNTTDNGAIPAFDEASIGCNLNSTGPVRLYEGKIGYWSFHNVAADQTFATAHAAGTHPTLLAGCQQFLDLVSDKTNSVGAWSFADVGTPTYDAADNAPVIALVGGDPTSITRSITRPLTFGITDRPREYRGRR